MEVLRILANFHPSCQSPVPVDLWFLRLPKLPHFSLRRLCVFSVCSFVEALTMNGQYPQGEERQQSYFVICTALRM